MLVDEVEASEMVASDEEEEVAGVDSVGKKRKEAVLGAFVSVKQTSRKRRPIRCDSTDQVASSAAMATASEVDGVGCITVGFCPGKQRAGSGGADGMERGLGRWAAARIFIGEGVDHRPSHRGQRRAGLRIRCRTYELEEGCQEELPSWAVGGEIE
jgi:hypothetical protein